jgi:phage tail sheath gpL-like
MLIVGQRIAAGSVAALVATQVFSESEAAAYFGAGSLCHLLARAAIRANPYLQLSVIALDDATDGAAARVHTLTLATNASSAGLLTLYIGNTRFQIAIASADTPTVIATALKAALDNDPNLPFSVAQNEGC